MSNLVQRMLFGTVYIAVLLLGICIGYEAFFVVFGLVCALCLYEFYTLLNNDEQVQIRKIPTTLAGVGLFLSCGSMLVYPSFIVALSILLFLSLGVSALYQQKGNAVLTVAFSALGWVYIALPLASATYLIANTFTFRFEFLLAVFVFIWVNDTFAYLTGMLLGKHRLFERISPKKSWEGFFGGLVFALASSLIFAHFYDSLSLVQWIGFAVVAVVAGTFGDLFESLIKRTVGVKDSGTLIPGHGGILDRFDSSLFAIPASTAYFWIIESFV